MSVSGGDAEFLAVGGPYDENGIGATWIFKFDGKSTYQQLGYKLVGRGVEGGKANQGKDTGTQAPTLHIIIRDRESTVTDPGLCFQALP